MPFPFSPLKPPVSGDFTVTKVVPEDFTPAAFNIFTTGNMRFRVEFFGTDVFRIQAAPNGEFADPLNDPTAAGDSRTIQSMGAFPLLRSNEILAFYAIPGATRYDATNVKFFSAKGLNGRSSEVFESTNYQGTIKHTTVSRYGLPVVGNGFGVLKFKIVD